MKLRYLVFGLAAAGAIGWYSFTEDDDSAELVQVAVSLPDQLSPTAQAGLVLFNENCAACHGANGSGSEAGPPLIHKIYEPSHHADLAFVVAAKSGARAHHWNFGDMDPVPGLADAELRKIIAYVREIQRANGIR